MIYHTHSLSELQFLITGGAGFIGSHITGYLLKHGAKKVRVLDNLSTGSKQNIASFMELPQFEFMEGDIRDITTCMAAVKDMDYVCHQAALGSVPRSINDPATTNAVNVTGFLNMLITVKDATRVKRMVYAASSSTYGDSKILPKVENVIGRPLSPYAVTKYVNELYAEVFAANYNTSLIGLRYFNIFGPRQDPNGAYAAVIPLFMKAIRNNESAIINGDGEQTRDFTYVDNAVQANVKAFFAPVEAQNEVFNIACNTRISINKLWEHLNLCAKTNILAEYGPIRQGDVRDSLADISKAQRLLGYVPEVTVPYGLELTWKAFNKS